MDNGGSEFPSVTEQASFVSEASGRAPSDPSRGIDHAHASTFVDGGLSTNIMPPKDSSATPSPNYQSNTESANMSSQRSNYRIMEQFNNLAIQPSTLSNWLRETEELCKFKRMREFAVKKYSPTDMVITATLAHQQFFRFRYHRAKQNYETPKSLVEVYGRKE